MKENLIDIKKFLPHRSPMLMVDYITELTENKVVTNFIPKKNNLFSTDTHLSEIGLIEHAAQSCSSIIGQNFFKTSEDNRVIGFIVNIKKINLFQLPKIETKIHSIAELISFYGNICHINCQSFDKNTLLSEMEINLLIQELPK